MSLPLAEFRKRILYIKPLANISFIDNDEKILANHFHVEVLQLNTKGVFNNLKSQLAILHRLIFKYNSFDIIYIWFADYYSFFPALLSKFTSKQCYIVIGGYDAAKVPEIKYGAHLNKVRSYFISKSCQWCSKILPVTINAEENLFKNIGMDLKFKSTVMYNMVDTNFFTLNSNIEKQNKVVYLANVANETGWKRKNIDFIVAIAQNMSHIEFELIGLQGEFHSRIENLGMVNVKSSGHLSKEYFKNKLAEAKVIALFSVFESFGISVGEGMLMGCIPLAMQHLGTAELIQDKNYLLETYSVAEATNKINFALQADDSVSRLFISQIKNLFSADRREGELMRNLIKM